MVLYILRIFLNVKRQNFKAYNIVSIFYKNLRDVREKIDPRDFSIENKNAETIIKMPGSVNGMQFIIQNLEVIETFVVNIKDNLSI